MKSRIYASDLAKQNQTDAFMGEGFEVALKKAQENGNDLIIGEFCDNKDWKEN
jgi:hypothetical protein